MCQQRDFEAETAIRALNQEVAQLTDLVARLESRLSDEGKPALHSAGGTRSISPVGAAGPQDDEVAEDHPRVREIVDAAPAELHDRILKFARSVVTDGDVARQQRPPRTATHRSRVVGGLPVPPGSFLSCACIGIPDWGCTGVVVAPHIVLTAAHCGDAIVRVMIGGTSVQPSLSVDARVIEVDRAVIHPGYVPEPASDNDINVLILRSPAGVPPARLATSEEIAAPTAFDVVGFGNDDPNRPIGFGTKRRATIPYPAILQSGDTELGDLPQALGFHPAYEFVCGRKFLAIDSCNGDSGGPIYVTAGGSVKLAGLTSRATKTAEVNCGDGGIYVQPEKFRDWINQVAQEAGVEPLP